MIFSKMTSAIIHSDTSISLLVTNITMTIVRLHIRMYLCAIIKIDCECSALLITVDNTFWTCVYFISNTTMAKISKNGFQITNVVALRYIELKCAICYKCVY